MTPIRRYDGEKGNEGQLDLLGPAMASKGLTSVLVRRLYGKWTASERSSS